MKPNPNDGIHEQFRRLLLLTYALGDAREELHRRNSEIDRDALDWLERERLEQILSSERMAIRMREELLLEDAYRGETLVAYCTLKEHRAVLALALGILEGRVSPQFAVEQLCHGEFPRKQSAARRTGK